MNFNKKLLRSYLNLVSEAPTYDIDSFDTVSKAQGTGNKKWRLGLLDYMVKSNMQGYFWKETPSVINKKNLSFEAAKSILETYDPAGAAKLDDSSYDDNWFYALVGVFIKIEASTVHLSPIMAIYNNDSQGIASTGTASIESGKSFILSTVREKINNASFISVFEIPDSQTITYKNVSNNYMQTEQAPTGHFNYIMNAAWATLRDKSGLTQEKLEEMGIETFNKMGQQPDYWC